MMQKKTHWTTLILSVIAILLLILDTQTVLSGARKGIEISFHTVIPSLFPFIFISTIIRTNLNGRRIPFIRTIGQICGIPDGAESLLLLALLGGYPVGAQLVSESYRLRQIEKCSAQRMLGFCNNAGPAFIFGILGPMFSNPITPYMLWLIHIISALLTGILLPGKNSTKCTIQNSTPVPIPKILEKSVKIVSVICGWVILFRCLIAVCDRWFMHLIPSFLKVLIVGFMELSNGCVSLLSIENEKHRFLLTACMLAAGGLCVGMQTKSITHDLGMGMYFPGKFLQTGISICMSLLMTIFLYPPQTQHTLYKVLIMTMLSMIGVCGISIYFRIVYKKRWHSASQWCIM